MKNVLTFAAALLLAAPALAGVVYEIEVTEADKTEVSKSEISVQDNLLKVTGSPGSEDFNGEMIFRGDRREMIIVNHEEQSYMVMDEATMKELAAKMNEAMAAMDQAMAAIPESQRARFEAMMKSKMPDMGAERVPSELRKTGDSDTIRGYPCVRYEIWRGGVRTRELWVTDWNNLEGGDDVTGAFQEMSAFFKEMLDSFSAMGSMANIGQGMADSAFEHLKEMNGFPVVAREFDDNGTFEGMAALESATAQDLDPAAFEPPAGYKRQEMMQDGKKRKRKK